MNCTAAALLECALKEKLPETPRSRTTGRPPCRRRCTGQADFEAALALPLPSCGPPAGLRQEIVDACSAGIPVKKCPDNVGRVYCVFLSCGKYWVKAYPEDQCSSPDEEAARYMSHPPPVMRLFVHFVGIFTAGGVRYMVTEDPGPDFKHIFEVPGLKAKERKLLSENMVRAIKTLHRAGVYHGDAHSSNWKFHVKTGQVVFIDPSGGDNNPCVQLTRETLRYTDFPWRLSDSDILRVIDTIALIAAVEYDGSSHESAERVLVDSFDMEVKINTRAWERCWYNAVIAASVTPLWHVGKSNSERS